MSRLDPRNAAKLFRPSWWTEKLFQIYLRLVAGPPQSAGIEGFLDPIEERCLQWAASRMPTDGTIVEVGSYHGKSAVNLAYAVRKRGGNARIYCVDTWRNENIEFARNVDVYQRFLDNTSTYHSIITTLRGRSEDVGTAWDKGPIDVLFIDGDHSFEGVTKDIRAWVPHVKRGGLLLFHDSGLEGVRRGIDESMDLLRPLAARKAWSIQVYRKG
jgi:predicted O-methyltransferase YrrM